MEKIIKIKNYYTIINKKYWRGTPVKERFFDINKNELKNELIRLKFNFEEEPYWNKYSQEYEKILFEEEKDINLAAKNILKRKRRKYNLQNKNYFETKEIIFDLEDFLNNNLKNNIQNNINYYCEYYCKITKGVLFEKNSFEISKNLSKEMFKTSQIYNYLINNGYVFYE